MFTDDTATTVVVPDSASLATEGTSESADNDGMNTLFVDEQATAIDSHGTSEGERTPPNGSDSLPLEDTLVEPPEEIQSVLHAAVLADALPVLDILKASDDAVLSQDDEGDSDVLPFGGPAELVVCSQTNGRTNNEDSYFVQSLPISGSSPALLLTLSDGMGGHDFGEHASRETLRKLALLVFEQYAIMPRLNAGGSATTAEEIGRTMIQAIPLVSGHVQRIAEINGWNRSGATLVAGVVVGDTAVFANVGDSPAYHVRVQRDYVMNLTEDHSLAGMLLKANLITAEMARVHEGRCQLEHYIGGPNLPNDIPLRTVTLKPGDYLLLCSDGISNTLSDEIILRLLSSAGELSERAVEFVVHARQAGEHDNQTIVLYRHGSETDAPKLTVVPDAGPSAQQTTEFNDNIPAVVGVDKLTIGEAQA